VRLIAFRLVALSFVVVASTSFGETIVARLYRDPGFQLYGLVLGVTVDSHSKVQTLRVASVSDSRHYPPVHVQVPIPRSFLAVVRRRADRKHYPPKFKDGKPVEFFIIYWYSPAYPTVLISDWEKSADQQP
jgi:hypothetical protein